MRRCAVIAAGLVLFLAPTAAAAQPTARAWTDRPRPFFGDTFTYVVEVAVDERGAEPVRIRAGAGPFVAVAAPVTTRSTSGGLTRVRLTQRLACLAAGCVPSARPRAVTLPTPHVTGAGQIEQLAPVVVSVRSRVAAAAVDADNPSFRRPAGLPKPTTRLAPGFLLALLIAAGIALLLIGAAALGGLRLGTRAAGRRVTVDPVARAIRLLRESAGRSGPDRRRAASLASRVVADETLAADAARIAWSRRAPDAPTASGLADRIEDRRRVSP